MKTLFYELCLMTVFSVCSVSAHGKTDYKEIPLSAEEPVSHIKDVQYFANPKFTPPPASIPEKAFLKNPLVDFAAEPSLWKARLFNSKGFLCLSKDQIARTESDPDSAAELVPVKPVVAKKSFDTFMLLGYAKNLTAVTVKFRRPNGKLFIWRSRNNNFNEILTGWHLLRIPLWTRLPAGTRLESIGFKTLKFRTNRPPDIWHLEQFDVVTGADHLKQPPVQFNPGEIVRIPVSPEGSRPVSRNRICTGFSWKSDWTGRMCWWHWAAV